MVHLPARNLFVFIYFPAFIFATFLLLFQPSYAYAALSSCSASVDPSSLPASSSQTFVFTVTNTGGATARWVQFSSNSSNQTISDGSNGNWGIQNTNDTTITFVTSGQIPNNDSSSFNVVVNSGSSEMGAQEWTVKLSDALDGSGSIDCSGSPSIAIVGNANPPPSISNVGISNVANSSVTISFDTDVSATSTIDYGLDDGYGTTTDVDSSSTSHSITITGLTTNTTYHYIITATNDAGSSQTDDATFTTAISADATSTPGPTSTPIVQTNTVTLPTPTPLPDHTNPTITLQALPQTPYKSVPVVKGTAGDNASVANVEYTTDNGKTWTRIKDVTGLSSTFAQFSFTPPIPSSDGAMSIKTRVKDSAGNIGQSTTITINIDTNGPEISLTTKFDSSFATPPLISGTATDPSGESSVLYSLDGINWQPVDQIKSDGNKTSFQFTPTALDDGNYPVSIKATDPLGNESKPVTQTMIIDRIPPAIGASLLFLGTQALSPNEEGTIQTVAHAIHSYTVSVVGGPISVIATLHPKSGGQDQQMVLQKNPDTLLWSARFIIPTPGTYSLSLYAKDGAGHIAQKEITQIHAIDEGSLVNETTNTKLSGTITVYTLDQSTSQFIVWDGSPYEQKNPIHMNPTQAFNDVLPPGTYYIEATSPGYKTVQTNSFTFHETTPIGFPLQLPVAPSIRVFSLTIPLPYFGRTYMTIHPEIPSDPTGTVTPPTADFSTVNLSSEDKKLTKESIRGGKGVITILNTWTMQTPTQLNELEQFSKNHPDIFVGVILPQEPTSVIAIYKRRGGYTIPLFTDPDGTFISSIPYHFGPTHYFFDHDTKSKKIVGGILSAEELYNKIP